MKKIIIVVFGILMFSSCERLTDEHYEAKEVIRDYLKNTLHNPKSLEEVDWSVLDDYFLTCKDTLNKNLLGCIRIIDWEKTLKYEKELGKPYALKLSYRAENGYGALRKGYLYATYDKKPDDDISFVIIDDIAYSKTLGKMRDINSKSMNPKYIYYKAYYFLLNEGKSSLNDFYNEYPEFKD